MRELGSSIRNSSKKQNGVWNNKLFSVVREMVARNGVGDLGWTHSIKDSLYAI